MPDPEDGSDEVDAYGMTCAELVELVTDYVEGTLPAADRARVDGHLGVCPPCVDVIDQWRRVIQLAGKLEPDDAERLSPDHRALLMAAFSAASEPT